jgi:hypothetical protein
LRAEIKTVKLLFSNVILLTNSKIVMSKKFTSIKLLLVLSFGLMLSWSANAQVTSASLSGIVKDASNVGMPGATVVAVHTPSGSKYGAISNVNGRYFIPGVRVGGPYSIEVTFVGYQQVKKEGVFTSLGNTANTDFILNEDGKVLDEVVVSASRGDIFNDGRTGTSLNLDAESIAKLPTINRSINDFTRLTPQSNGTSFAGTSSRFNNYTIDGNIYNNNFGLGSGQFAGSNPVSLDAIEAVQVNIAPYDVRQSGFTGANVNAITRSGNNTFSGSVYRFLRNDQMIGDKAGDLRLSVGDSKTDIMGFRLGGPIIKDKLFFFVNYETETEEIPSFQKFAARPGLAPDGLTISRVPADRLDFVSNSLSSLYGYETGPYENYSFASEQTRFNARLDYNINQNNKVSVRFNSYSAFTDVPTNGNSNRFLSTRYRNTSRTGIEAMNFRNTNYTNDRTVNSIVGELTSRIGNNMSNQLVVGYTSVTDPKRGVPGGQDFPFIEVLEPDASGNLLYYFSVGNELFTVGNLLENKVLNITDNFTLYKGAHTLTFGANLEYMTFDNAFNPVFNGFYRFTSYDSFVESVINQNSNAFPDAFAKSYALDGSTTPPTDQTRFGQFGIYAQDEFQAKPNLKLTLGLRVDLPFYPIDIPSNQLLDEKNKTFTDLNGNTVQPDVATFPSVNPLFSPRVGVNWDVFGDKRTQVRGGTGIFSGRIPFVWLSNQVNGSGVIRGGLGFEGSDVADSGIIFNPDVTAYNPENSEQTLSNELNITDRKFRLPQVWRTNIGVDQKLPGGIIGTFDFIYSRDVTTPIAYNPIVREPDGVFNGPDARPYWNGRSYSSDDDFRNVFYLTNANRLANYYSLTFQLQKQFTNGLSTMVAYTRSRSQDLDAAGGSQAASLWPATVRQDRNNPELSFSGQDQPNRLLGTLSYQNGGTIVGIVYDGGEAGRFSYAYSGNFGDASNRLMYVPNNASELQFQEFSLGGERITAARQAELLNAYIDQDDYLSSRRGQVAERNGAKRPWVNSFDLRLTQDINITKDAKNRLQLSLDFLNVGNLLNSAWGIPQFEFQDNLLNYRGVDAATQQPIYRLNTIPGTSDFPTETFRNSTSLGNTWRLQVGARYIFN